MDPIFFVFSQSSGFPLPWLQLFPYLLFLKAAFFITHNKTEQVGGDFVQVMEWSVATP